RDPSTARRSAQVQDRVARATKRSCSRPPASRRSRALSSPSARRSRRRRARPAPQRRPRRRSRPPTPRPPPNETPPPRPTHQTPDGKRQDVFWKDLGELLEAVRRLARLRTPDGPLVILGHSGAYRTLAEWIKYPRVDEMILLDALYANEDDFRAWIESMPRHK